MEAVPRRKLTREQVVRLRSLRAQGRTITELAELFDLPRSSVWLVANRYTYRDVDGGR